MSEGDRDTDWANARFYSFVLLRVRSPSLQSMYCGKGRLAEQILAGFFFVCLASLVYAAPGVMELGS